MIFECGMIERRDNLGWVRARGVAWCEPNRFAESAMIGLGSWGWKFAWYFAFFGVIFGLLLRVDELVSRGLFIGVVLFVVGTACIFFGARFPATKRSLLFRHDGFISTPQGIAGRSDMVGKWKLRHQEIMNIEAVQTAGMRQGDETEYTHAVRLILTNGKSVKVASHLKFEDAAQVVACLMTALLAVRDEVSVEVGEFVLLY